MWGWADGLDVPFLISVHQTGRSGLPNLPFRLSTLQSIHGSAGFIDLDKFPLSFKNTLSDGN